MTFTGELWRRQAISRLKAWQPLAADIRARRTPCPSCHVKMHFDYTLPGLNDDPLEDEQLELCHMWCAACGFTGASIRHKQ